MSQSLCARCLDPIPVGRGYQAKILCDACESAWRVEFNRNLHHHLARLSDRFDPARAIKQPLPLAAD